MYESLVYASYLQGVFGLMTTVIILAFVGLVAFALLNPTRTKKYRQELSDLYVAAKIRETAKEENILLNEEYNCFMDWNKKRLLSSKVFSYDERVEQELQEKIEKKLEKREKK